MKILQVCPYAWTARGGVQTHVADLARQLRVRGHQVLVLTPADDGAAATVPDGGLGAEEVRLRRSPQGTGDGLRPALEPGTLHVGGGCTRVAFNGSRAPVCLHPGRWLDVRDVIAGFGPDLVHVHEPFAPSLSLPAAWFSPAPVVATFHMHAPRRLESALLGAAAFGLRPLVRRIAVNLAVSRAAASSVDGRVAGTVHVVPNGIEIERFAAAPELPLPGARKLLLVNRLDRRKGFDVALRAFMLLAPRHDGLQLIVAGDGPDRRALEQLPARFRGRVTMLGDVPSERLPSVYAAADVFLAPARGRESFGIVLLEAMAAGVPIVASDIPGYREVLRAGRDGLLVEPGDAEALAAAAARVLSSRPLAAALVAEAGVRVAQFRWDAIAARIEGFYDLALATARVHGRPPLPAGLVAPDVT